jgi:hypothetical protein
LAHLHKITKRGRGVQEAAQASSVLVDNYREAYEETSVLAVRSLAAKEEVVEPGFFGARSLRTVLEVEAGYSNYSPASFRAFISSRNYWPVAVLNNMAVECIYEPMIARRSFGQPF